MPTPEPISPGAGASTQPVQNTASMNTSGGGTSGVQDWYVHIQTVDLMYMRSNQYNATTSSTVTSPAVESNYLDVRYTVQTIDEVYYGAFFSGATSDDGGELYKPQTLELVTTVGTSGGFGIKGVVNTSTAGYIRRAVRKDAAGNILDTTGTCTQSGNMIIDQMPGEYDQTFDTSAQVNSNIIQVMGVVATECPTFKASLVDL